MSRSWAVHERVPKFNKNCTMNDINKIGRLAAKRHREQFGCNPSKKVADDSVNESLVTFPVYHYKDEGLFLLDEVIVDYFKTLDKQSEELDSINVKDVLSTKANKVTLILSNADDEVDSAIEKDVPF